MSYNELKAEAARLKIPFIGVTSDTLRREILKKQEGAETKSEEVKAPEPVIEKEVVEQKREHSHPENQPKMVDGAKPKKPNLDEGNANRVAARMEKKTILTKSDLVFCLHTVDKKDKKTIAAEMKCSSGFVNTVVNDYNKKKEKREKALALYAEKNRS